MSSHQHVLNGLVILSIFYLLWVSLNFRLGSITPFEDAWQCREFNKIKGDCSGETVLINESICKYQLYLLQVILILLQGEISFHASGLYVATLILQSFLPIIFCTSAVNLNIFFKIFISNLSLCKAFAKYFL